MLQKKLHHTKLYHILAKEKPRELGLKMGQIKDESKITNQQDNMLYRNHENVRKRLLS
jgi:hypothetical protein